MKFDCPKCERKFVLDKRNSLLHVSNENEYLKWLDVSCRCGQEYVLFMERTQFEILRKAKLRTSYHSSTPPGVMTAYNRTFFPEITDEQEQTVARFVEELAAFRS